MRGMPSWISMLVAALFLVLGTQPTWAQGAPFTNFHAVLSGDEEVPPVDTDARGLATFRLNPAGNVLLYKLLVANIDRVTQSHIHLAPAGQNGGIVAFLFGFADPSVTTNGLLAEGALTDDDLKGTLAGATLVDLVAEIEAGNAYVNVHTTEVPSGEIRGQIK